jgi:hypothetical protein
MEEKFEKEVNDEDVASTGDNSLSALPAELISHIASFLNIKEKVKLARTCKANHIFFKPDLNKAVANLLIKHALRGEEDKALAMIKANPELLLVYGSAKDYSGRSYEKVTALQAALYTHDRWMWQKMLPLFKKIKIEKFDDYDEISIQFHEIFPNGIPEQKPYDFDALVQVIEESPEEDITAAIEKRDNGSKLSVALDRYRKEFTALSLSEEYFNPEHLMKARTIYNKKLDSWPANKLCVLLSQVYGFVQRFNPTCYAQAFSQGLYSYVVEKNKPLVRSLEIDSVVGRINYFPLAEKSGVGFDFGIYARLFGRRGGWGAVGGGGATRVVVDKFCTANTAELRDFQYRLSFEEQPSREHKSLMSMSRGLC